jgi:hypothetical protein
MEECDLQLQLLLKLPYCLKAMAQLELEERYKNGKS